ncbi:MAG: peptidase E [Bacteroidia bacterium]|nr:peptidase E [Bacteroidia bacterium]MBT8268583.1 peptidase E [Bacteroidia bacterium]NNF81737.1 peptidase E [Flavobacteriaceae bacterium]NNK69612.1 peptidase E [Flavobacteriaceae bacterium]NNL79718.1 peptidase E [Flavobacteriaceae bacterium]
MSIRNFVILFVLPLVMSVSDHKFYVSVTQLDYIEDRNSVQIISRIFIDDFERLLRERYDEGLTLAMENESSMVDFYTEKYLKEKFLIQIDGKLQTLVFIGKEYEDDIMFAYLEIEEVENINTIEISNEVLFDLFEDQQNIIRTNILAKKKSFILTRENAKGVLNF